MIIETDQPCTINIYCDESRHTNTNDSYMVIGSVSCLREKKEDIFKRIYLLRKDHQTWSEFGWKTISPNRGDFYLALIEMFRSEPELSFRCLVVDRTILNHEQYNSGDNELGFYKLYYQMLVHRLKPGCSYYIYLDWQRNKDQKRFITLRDILRRKLSGKAKIMCLEPVSSHTAQLIQLTDLFIGAVGYAWNKRQGSPIKLEFCKALASAVDLTSLNIGTGPGREKFNIFHFTGR
jgi:hypothetical protein